MTTTNGPAPSHGFRRRLTLALAMLGAIAAIQGAFAVWAVREAERHVLRGRVAADIKLGFIELRSDKHQLRNWLAQRQFGADADDRQRDVLLDHMRLTLSRLKELAAQAVLLDDSPTARQRQAQRRDALLVLDASLGQMARGLASLNPPPAGFDTTAAWRIANDLFDRMEGRDLRVLLSDSMTREENALTEKRANTDRALQRLQALWIGTTAALVGTALLLAFGFSRALRRPLARLTEGAVALRSGNLTHRIVLRGNDEFVAVANSMNAMAAELADHRAREAQVRLDLEKQVAARTVELSTALTSLWDAETRRRRLFADISHELRTPTTAIRGEAQITLRGGEKSTDEYCASLRRIEETSRQLSRAIDDLLSMARSDIDALSMHHQPVDLAVVLNEVRANGDAIGRAAGVTIECETWPAGLTMLGDADRLRQLLLAIVDNAIRYSRPGQSVRLWARRIDHDIRCVEVHVADQGIGIEPDELSQVFNRGHRAANAVRHRSDGSGFGLPIAIALARGHGGDISISSELETGTTVIVRLPLTKDQIETSA